MTEGSSRQRGFIWTRSAESLCSPIPFQLKNKTLSHLLFSWNHGGPFTVVDETWPLDAYCLLGEGRYKTALPLLFSRVWLFATPWTAAHQAPLSFTISQSLLKLMSIESVMPSNQFVLCCPLLPPSIFPSIRSFPTSRFFVSGGQSIGASASALVLPMNVQGWSPLGLTGLISLLSKGLSRVFSSTPVQKHSHSLSAKN